MKKFDDIIRHKLEQLPVEGTPDWSAMQSRLDGDAFDSLLRDQLASTTNSMGADKVAPAVIGWDALSTKLDRVTDVEGDVFDRILSQKLANVETALEPQASWKVLSHRMDTLWPLRKVLVRYRVLEMAAAIALLLTFAPLLRDNPVATGGASTSSTSTDLQELSQISVELDAAAAAAGQFLQPAEIAALMYADNNQTALQIPAETASSIGHAFLATSEVDQNTNSVYSPFVFFKGVFDWFAQSIPAQGTPPAAQENARAFSISSLEYSSVSMTSLNINSARPETNLDYASIDRNELAPLKVAKDAIPAIALPSTKASKWEVGAQAGFQTWNISTPVDYEFEQQAHNRWRPGSTFGISANRSLSNRTALGFGASLSSLKYDPNLPTVSDAADVNSFLSWDRTESFDGISLNIAQVPLDFRVQLSKPNKRFKLWAFTGIAANFTLTSKYDGKILVGEEENNPASGPVSEIEEIVQVERVYSAAKDFSPGILTRGGKLAGNTFFSARAGLESSFELNDRVSVFSSLSYNQQLPITSGIGPNNDRLSSAVLSVGARVSL